MVGTFGGYRELVSYLGESFYTDSNRRRKQIEKLKRTYDLEKGEGHSWILKGTRKDPRELKKVELKLHLKTTILTLLILLKPEDLKDEETVVYNFTFPELAELVGLNNSNFSSENLYYHRKRVRSNIKELRKLESFISFVRSENKSLITQAIEELMLDGGVSINWSYRGYLDNNIVTLDAHEQAKVEGIYLRLLKENGYEDKRSLFRACFMDRSIFTHFYKMFGLQVEAELGYYKISEVVTFGVSGETFKTLEERQTKDLQLAMQVNNYANLARFRHFVETRVRNCLEQWQQAESTGFLAKSGEYDTDYEVTFKNLLITYVQLQD